MKELLLVAVGGALGSAARYSLSGFILHHTLQQKFPYGTFAVNVIGCLLAGVLVGLAEKHDLISMEGRLFLLVGILGGFTTFSAFGVETIHLIRRGDLLVASSYVVFSVLCGLAALWLAYYFVPFKKG
jgi:fluoride exporter